MNGTTKHYLTHFMTALAIGLALVVAFTVGILLDRHLVTTPGSNAHEVICERGQQ